MNSPEARNSFSNSVVSLQQSTKEKIKNLLFVGIGGFIGYNVMTPAILGAVIGGISGHILHRILKI